MLRPRDRHDLRLISTNLDLPPPAAIRWMTTFSATRSPSRPSQTWTELRIENDLRLETFADEGPPFQITPEAARYPFVYWADDRIISVGCWSGNMPIGGRLEAWARGFVCSNPTDTLALLADLNIRYRVLDLVSEPETEDADAAETLDRGWGSCRDSCGPLIEAARCLGFGARVVLGYLYNSTSSGAIGAGTTEPGPTSMSRAPAGSSRSDERTIGGAT